MNDADETSNEIEVILASSKSNDVKIENIEKKNNDKRSIRQIKNLEVITTAMKNVTNGMRDVKKLHKETKIPSSTIYRMLNKYLGQKVNKKLIEMHTNDIVGKTVREVAKEYGLKRMTAYRYMKKIKEKQV